MTKKKKPTTATTTPAPGTATAPAIAVVTLVRMKLADLKKSPENPREITPHAAAGLRRSIERFGLVEPIIFNQRTGFIVGGHQRFDSLVAGGVLETDVVKVDLPPDEERTANLILNAPAIQGTFSEDLAPLVEEIQSKLQGPPEDWALDTVLFHIDRPWDASDILGKEANGSAGGHGGKTVFVKVRAADVNEVSRRLAPIVAKHGAEQL